MVQKMKLTIQFWIVSKLRLHISRQRFGSHTKKMHWSFIACSHSHQNAFQNERPRAEYFPWRSREQVEGRTALSCDSSRWLWSRCYPAPSFNLILRPVIIALSGFYITHIDTCHLQRLATLRLCSLLHSTVCDMLTEDGLPNCLPNRLAIV